MSAVLNLNTHLRSALRRDPRVHSALAYGSLTQGTGDEYSDVEYYVWSNEAIDAATWLRQALTGSSWTVLHAVTNDFGTPNFVLTGLKRVELHTRPVAARPEVLDWPSDHLAPERMLVKDADGHLAALLAQVAARPPASATADAQGTLDRLVNWLCFGFNVLARGERVRALELLGWVQGSLLRLARLQEGSMSYWLNASRRAESELSGAALERYAEVTGGINDLERCYAAAWTWTLELAHALGLHLNTELVQALSQCLSGALPLDSAP
ncbi:hypothetical protein [Deinococcus wulumuqiensis]|uniref:hypothetical protein n=1 Tax=Deinococcus wulumuqiensis TaxID=980427 RepID=UPI0024321F19|nr:hypothetical protein [Deinococcus wulumuqiensis]